MDTHTIEILSVAAAWVGALGTVGAFTAAFSQIHADRKRRGERERRELVMKEQEEAAKVSAWVDIEGSVVVSNSSSHPAHNMSVFLADGKKFSRYLVAPGITNIGKAGSSQDKVDRIEFVDSKLGIKWVKAHGKPLKRA